MILCVAAVSEAVGKCNLGTVVLISSAEVEVELLAMEQAEKRDGAFARLVPFRRLVELLLTSGIAVEEDCSAENSELV